MRWVCVLWVILLWISAAVATAHEMRPAFLALQEGDQHIFDVLLKVPAMGDQRLGLYASLPERCTPLAEPLRSSDGSAYTERWTVRCTDGLRGGVIGIDGLSATLTDALVRIGYADGSAEIARLTPEAPVFTVAGAQTGWEVAQTYFVLGADHILFGIDHLVFVLALILLIRAPWMLFKTITAFTVAHSITLAGATLGLFNLPQKPVEAAIALSIAFVARELLLQRPGEARLSDRMPWVVAFAFGLLHGFGFATALKDTGLPQGDVPLALLTFNLGVEAGQIVFVLLVLAAIQALRALSMFPAFVEHRLVPYLIGTVAMVWLLSRLATFAAVA